MLGNRGVPARWGGSDTAVEEIGARLVERGHQVIVYCRRHHDTIPDRYYRGMERVVLPSPKIKNADTLVHSLLSIGHVLLHNNADVLHFNGVGNSLLLPLLKPFPSKRSVVTIDGPDWTRPKWGKVARWALRTSVPFMVRFADAIISDNVLIRQFLRDQYQRDSFLVFYGADQRMRQETDVLNEYGLQPRQYMMCAGVLTPDKGQDVAIKAFQGVTTDVQLLVLGVAPYPQVEYYARQLRQTTDSRIRFLGYIPGEGFKQIVSHALLYLHPLLADGSSPALIQALGLGKCVIASDLPETMGIVGDAGVSFPAGDVLALRQQIEKLLAHPEQIAAYEQQARERAKAFDWDVITRQHEIVYEAALNGTGKRGGGIP
jgi:glycosyltransferase involved in cell wall biosynthesis